MARAVVSSRFRVVIPKEVRAAAGVKAGDVLQVIVKRGAISLIGVRPVAEYRGFLEGMSTSGLREKRTRS